jgi:hypothetical protein
LFERLFRISLAIKLSLLIKPHGALMKFGLLLNHQVISKYFFGRFKTVLLRCSFLLYMCCGYGNKKAAASPKVQRTPLESPLDNH